MTPVDILKTIYQIDGYPGLLAAMDTTDFGALSLSEIAEVLDLPVSTARKIEQTATRKLRHPSISRDFLEFMKDKNVPDT